MTCNELGKYVLIPCCNDAITIEVCVPQSEINSPLGDNVYLYTGATTDLLITGTCYNLTYIPNVTGPNTVPLYSIDVIAQNNNCIGGECPVCLTSYSAVNCIDPSLFFDFTTENSIISIGQIIELNINSGDPIILGNDNLCIDNLRINHPEIAGGGVTLSTEAYKQLGLYNGKLYYLITLTEADHGVPALVITLYIIWNALTVRWEVWPEFDPMLGPSNSACPAFANTPFLILIPDNSIPNVSCSEPFTTTLSDSTGCSFALVPGVDYENDCNYHVASIRSSQYCQEAVLIHEFINCWEITANVATLPEHPTYEVITDFTDCGECGLAKNTPPCIEVTDCATGTVLYYSATTTLLGYVGKVILVQLGIEQRCYQVALSQTCPELPSALPGIIVDCFNDCETCVPQCICTRARNDSNTARRLQYRDCNNQIQETLEVVGPGRLSRRYCVYAWLSDDISITEFGNCIDNICPETPRPRRIVTPGYNTPICTPAQYERIVCRYAEAHYKNVLTKRYGIANCCDNEELSNDIKYELIHLQMLEDPDYVCTNNPTLCPPGCGYLNMNIVHECPPPIPEIEEPEEEPEEDI